MTIRKREIAKFLCGFEAFHGLLWFSGTNMTSFDVTARPTWHAVSSCITGLVAAALGVYAWRAPRPGGRP